MTKVNYSKRRCASVANSSQGRWLLATFATMVGCTLWAVANAAEQIDSGWAVGVPSPFSTGGRDEDPHQQMLLRRVLDETNVPLLKTVPNRPSAPTGTAQSAAGNQAKVDSQKEPRVASRPEGVDGWHPSNPAAPASSATPQAVNTPLAIAPSTALASPSTDATTAPIARPTTPQFETPKIPIVTTKTPSSDDAECDGSGQPQHVTTAKQPTHSPALPSLADAYNLLPSDAPSTTAARKQYPADGPDHEAMDAEALKALGSSLEADCSGAAPGTVPVKIGKSSSPAIGPIADDATDAAPDTSAGGAVAVEQKPAPLVVPRKPAPVSAATEKPNTSATTQAAPPIVQPTAQPAAPPPLTKQLLALRTRVRTVLKGYYRKQLNTADNDPWEVMHGMLAYELQSRVRQGGPNGNPITSVGWLCYNKPCKGQALLYVNPEGEVRAKYGVGLQGHLGQLLAMLAQCHVSADYPIHVGKNEFTVHDLIEAEKKTCYPKSELTFKLIALQHYIDLNEKWVNDQGVEWDFPRLISEEIAQPIRGAACGGTHRLSGLSLAVKKRIERGEPLDGEYARADEFVKKYQQYAFRLQNRDGSLSTQWFRGAGDEDDLDRRIKTTGHILEWLCYSLSDEELREPQTVRAVTYLSNIMYSNYDHEWEIGPRSHATHALMLYDERVFQPFDAKDAPVAVYQTPPQVAKSNQATAAKR